MFCSSVVNQPKPSKYTLNIIKLSNFNDVREYLEGLGDAIFHHSRNSLPENLQENPMN